jgi:hypothetical protein
MRDEATINRHLAPYRGLAHFQLRIAQQWFDRGEKTSDVFAKFFFFYTAFNALSFLWKEVDSVGAGDIPQIENLAGRLNGTLWQKLERDFPEPIESFTRRPIERMGKRKISRPSRGEGGEGRRHQRVLADPGADPSEKLKALANVLYIVRCNLTHGSKMIMGDDLNIIQSAVPLLRVLSSRAIAYTKAGFGEP